MVVSCPVWLMVGYSAHLGWLSRKRRVYEMTVSPFAVNSNRLVHIETHPPAYFDLDSIVMVVSGGRLLQCLACHASQKEALAR